MGNYELNKVRKENTWKRTCSIFRKKNGLNFMGGFGESVESGSCLQVNYSDERI